MYISYPPSKSTRKSKIYQMNDMPAGGTSNGLSISGDVVINPPLLGGIGGGVGRNVAPLFAGAAGFFGCGACGFAAGLVCPA